jgi:putative flippase GtrA
VKKTIEQIIKFSAVGVICFIIDYFIGLAVMNILLAVFGEGIYTSGAVIASVCGFVISVIIN